MINDHSLTKYLSTDFDRNCSKGVSFDQKEIVYRSAGSGVADPQAMRVFLGIQGSVLMIKGFAHLNVGFNGAIGGQLGVRVAM